MKLAIASFPVWDQNRLNIAGEDLDYKIDRFHR